MELIDEIKTITFRNEENGYSVVRLKKSGTATGYFAVLGEGQILKMTGDWVKNAKYGEQFVVSSASIVLPSTLAQTKAFLGSGLIAGVRAKTAERIVKTLGLETLEIIKNDPEKLARVKGITREKARAIGERYNEIQIMEEVILFLQKFEISLNMSIKIFNFYKGETIKQIQVNPYNLIETIDGIGFLTADKIAMQLGIAYSGNFRVRAGIIYALKVACDGDGHTYLPLEKLFKKTLILLKIKTEELMPVFRGVINELCLDKYLVWVSRASGDEGVALSYYFNAEKRIADKIAILNQADPEREGDNYDDLIAEYQEISKIKLHEKQKDAVSSAIKNGFSVITGGPGTGKTTIIKAILHIIKAEKKTVRLLAPTGRAAKRMEDATGERASTIHRALGIDAFGRDFNGRSGDAAEKFLREDVIIVDETSMCDVVLVAQLLARIMQGTSVVFVGDVDQLPSVGAGNVLCDIISSGVCPVVRLTEIYRQSEKSKIVVNAHLINKGEMPDISNISDDFFFETAENPSEIKEKIVSLVLNRLPKFLKTETSQIQVLSPMKTGLAGVNNLNIELQAALNPSENGKKERKVGETTFREGDRVMQIHNDYNQDWTRDGEEGSGVFNGDIGRITEINRHNGEVEIEFEDGRVAVYESGGLQNITLSYAITVHKSQGCEFDAVVIPITTGAYMILTRNLLYTAVTRAKKLVMLVGSRENVQKMVANTYTSKRYSMLADLLIVAKNKIETFFG
ncbi:MAG: ATP-dependent RecD-like DNA helicase [Christensenellaceae bacterium]|jgi:exodeoxyribonuclease V alpha subunit|nr:ATP-dependent RecD-like DNA helicase [Christensenellaceae bacterium]